MHGTSLVENSSGNCRMLSKDWPEPSTARPVQSICGHWTRSGVRLSAPWQTARWYFCSSCWVSKGGTSASRLQHQSWGSECLSFFLMH